jgi:hypothetical protein
MSHSYEVPFWRFLVLWIQHVIFFTYIVWASTWRKPSYHQTLRRFYGVTSFSRHPILEFFWFENQDDLCFWWDFGLWILTTWPAHSSTLAYWRPIHLISIEFRSIDNNLGTLPKKLFIFFQLLYFYNLHNHFDWDFFYKLLEY